MQSRLTFLASVAAVLLVVLPLPCAAQVGVAGQPLRIIVATPPGGASDAAARLVAQSLTKSLQQQVIVENKPGGNGVPAVQTALSAAPDGRTLLWAMSSMAGMPMLVRSSPVESFSEFTPVVPVVNLTYGLFVNANVPASTVAELTAYLKSNPDRLNYGTGTLSEYMVTVHYLHTAGLKAVRVPYKGGAQLMSDLISGELQFNVGPLTPALPHVRSGKLRVLATLPDRSDALPAVPSLAEVGVPTSALPTWNGLVAPPHTPPAITERIAREVNRALAEPEVRRALEAQGFRISGGTPQQMRDAIDSATQAWRQFVRDYEIPQE